MKNKEKKTKEDEEAEDEQDESISIRDNRESSMKKIKEVDNAVEKPSESSSKEKIETDSKMFKEERTIICNYPG